MAQIQGDGKVIEVADGSKIQDACEELGVPFGCRDGRCGTCRIEIKEGKENLSEINYKEKELFANEDNRYACQCSIKQGTVKLNL
jgi:ferredoxin